MPRKKLIRQNKFPYHVTIRSNNKDWFDTPLTNTWNLFLRSLEYAYIRNKVKIHCLVLMNNHYHILLTTPESNIDRFMFFLNKSFSERIRAKTKKINYKFGGRYRWSIVSNQRYLHNVIRYIFQNPIRAGLTDTVGDWKFSSFQKRKLKSVPLIKILDEDCLEFEKWVNQVLTNDSNEAIRKGLRKKEFKISSQLTKYNKPNINL